MRPSPSALRPTPARLWGGADNADSGSDDDADDASELLLATCTNATVVNPLLPRPAVAPTPEEQRDLSYLISPHCS